MKFPSRITLSTLCLAALGACSTTPYTDQALGRSVNIARVQQTLNPDASKNTDPVAGIGGVPAQESVTRYNDSFKAPPPTFAIITGGTVSGGQ